MHGLCVCLFVFLHNNRTGESCASEDIGGGGGGAVMAGLFNGYIPAV